MNTWSSYLPIETQMDLLIDHSGGLTSSTFTYLMNEHARFTYIFFKNKNSAQHAYCPLCCFKIREIFSILLLRNFHFLVFHDKEFFEFSQINVREYSTSKIACNT